VVVISTALVMLMTPGLAFFLRGLVRAQEHAQRTYAVFYDSVSGEHPLGFIRIQFVIRDLTKVVNRRA